MLDKEDLAGSPGLRRQVERAELWRLAREHHHPVEPITFIPTDPIVDREYEDDDRDDLTRLNVFGEDCFEEDRRRWDDD